ncbi:hypothetical protein EJ08DRAFT_327664 [Tothia fuscella]|uniref:Uncharacterized protein n=1 Tax=Tothia fuscella TaxID=1048955 RepID=A0A9P4NMT8_9PEZI|nr:hypothetical protein EJ08DRAFT_327664 [Tothia fuscella]
MKPLLLIGLDHHHCVLAHIPHFSGEGLPRMLLPFPGSTDVHDRPVTKLCNAQTTDCHLPSHRLCRLISLCPLR